MSKRADCRRAHQGWTKLGVLPEVFEAEDSDGTAC
jgi:hypothetical protein